MLHRDRRILFHPGAMREWNALPETVRERAILQFDRLRSGQRPTHWKPLSDIASGVIEIRIRNGRAFRVVCATGLAEAIYVLAAFEKKSRKMPGRTWDLARRRYRQLISGHARGGEDEGIP